MDEFPDEIGRISRPGSVRSAGRFATALVVLALTIPASASAETGVAPSAAIGMFFEFGDEAGFSGGFSLWAGATVYPDVDPVDDGAAFFVSPGLEFRTGAIPFLTGPNQVSPQVRMGVALLGSPDERDSTFSNPDGLVFPDLKLAAILGYRWAFAFGLDNADGRRRDENAFRVGVDLSSVGFLRLLDPIPMLNAINGTVDINTDGTIDRFGFSAGFGF